MTCRFDPAGKLCECADRIHPDDMRECVYWQPAPPPPMEDEVYRRGTSWQETCALAAIVIVLTAASLGAIWHAAARSCT